MPALRPGQSVVGDVSTNWTDLDPILPRAVIGIENDTGKGKIGDGVTRWTLLSYNIAPPVAPPSLSSYMKVDGSVPFTGHVDGIVGASSLGNLTTWQDVQQLHYEMPERHPVRVASTENVDVEVVTEIDGVTLNIGDRVLLKDQTDKTQNGIYVYLDDEV